MKGIGLLGKKIGMSRFIDEKGVFIPVTLIKAGPNYVVNVKKDSKGRESVALGFEVVKEKALNKPQLGVLKKAGVPPVRFVREFRYPGISEKFEVGQEVNVADVFADGELVDVIGTSKGRGFAGAMKRWGFAGGPKTHGARGWHRRVGAIGNRTYPGEVKPGKKMSGHYGNSQVTVRNLKIVKVIPEQNIIAVKGSVPGSRNGFVCIRKAYGLGPEERSE